MLQYKILPLTSWRAGYLIRPIMCLDGAFWYPFVCFFVITAHFPILCSFPSQFPRVEAGKNTSTVIPASRNKRRKGNPIVSDETVLHGYESFLTLTTDRLHYKLHTRPVVREGAPRRRAKQLSDKRKEISLDKLQKTIDGWYLLQIFTSIPFTNYSLYVSWVDCKNAIIK
jgi:hypothetical protein